MEFISSTMFEGYEKCPFRFKHEHILGTLTDDMKENKYSATGSALHDVFEVYSKIRPLEPKHVLDMHGLYREKFNTISDGLFEGDKDDFLNKGLLTIANWYHEETSLNKPIPLMTEQQHFFTLDGIDTKIRVTFDRINGEEGKPDEWEVEDYKTGKVYSSDMLRDNMQLPIYALAIKHLYGALPKILRLRFPQHTDKHGTVQNRVFERFSDDMYVCDVKRGGTYTISLSERIERMKQIYNDIKRGHFPCNTKNEHFCNNFCAVGKNGMCDGLTTKWGMLNKRGY